MIQIPKCIINNKTYVLFSLSSIIMQFQITLYILIIIITIYA